MITRGIDQGTGTGSGAQARATITQRRGSAQSSLLQQGGAAPTPSHKK